MKPFNLKNKTISGFAFLLLLAFTQCSGSGTGTDGSADETDPAATPSNAATRGVTDSVSSSLTSVTGGGIAALHKAKRAGEEEEDAAMEDYSCVYAESAKSVTCNCPGGGTVTQSYESDEVIGFEDEDGDFSFNHSFSAVFDECVMITCDESQTLDGTVNGTVNGSYDSTNGFNLTAVYGTAEACSGMAVNEATIGFQLTMVLENDEETVSGSVCIDGESITFDSYDDLDELFGTTDGCYETTDESEEEGEEEWSEDDWKDDEEEEMI